MNGIPNVDVVVVTCCKDCKHSALPSELTQRYGKPGDADLSQQICAM